MTKKERAKRARDKRLLCRMMRAHYHHRRIVFGGLGAACVVFLSQLLTVAQLDWAQQAAAACFAVAIPACAGRLLESICDQNEARILVFFRLMNEEEEWSLNGVFRSVVVFLTGMVAMLGGALGIAFVFYHFSPTLCWVFTGAALLAGLSEASRDLELDQDFKRLEQVQKADAKKKASTQQEVLG